MAPLKRLAPPLGSSLLGRGVAVKRSNPLSLGRTLFALVFALTSCRRLPAAPPQPQDDAVFAEPVDARLPGLADDPPAPYRIMPGDVFRLRVASVDPIDAPD